MKRLWDYSSDSVLSLFSSKAARDVNASRAIENNALAGYKDMCRRIRLWHIRMDGESETRSLCLSDRGFGVAGCCRRL